MIVVEIGAGPTRWRRKRKAKTGQPEYTLERARTNLGRLAELTDAEQRVMRRNDVVFEEGDETNAAYWYRLTGRAPTGNGLDEEWAQIVRTLLNDADD